MRLPIAAHICFPLEPAQTVQNSSFYFSVCATLIEAESLYHLGAGHCEEGKCNFVLYVAMDQISDVFYMWKDSGTDRGSRAPSS